jgi:hypothetical protein
VSFFGENFVGMHFPIICFVKMLSPAQAFSEGTYEKIYRSEKAKSKGDSKSLKLERYSLKTSKRQSVCSNRSFP